jgi:hypothetical protein
MKIVCLAMAVFVCVASSAQTDSTKATDTINTAKIYLIRATGITGSAVNFRVLVDSVVYCKIRNNRYSVIYVQPGTHDFYATTWDAPKPKEKLALKIPVEAGKTYYLSMRMKQRFFENEMFFEEVTYNTAAPLLQKYQQVHCD